MNCDLAHRRVGDKADVRGHAFFAAHRHCSAHGVEVDLLLPEIERSTAFTHILGLHAEHALVERDATVEIVDGQIEMVYALDLHGGHSEELDEVRSLPRRG